MSYFFLGPTEFSGPLGKKVIIFQIHLKNWFQESYSAEYIYIPEGLTQQKCHSPLCKKQIWRSVHYRNFKRRDYAAFL